MEIKNLTPHAITLIIDENTKVTFPTQGEPIRLEQEQTPSESVGSFPCVTNKVVGSNLPPEEEGIFLLVSSMVLAAFPERGDLIAPDTGSTATRNERGHIVGLASLANGKKIYQASFVGLETFHRLF